MQSISKLTKNKLTASGILISMGIVFGDIGTSPLYVMNAFINTSSRVTTESVLGFLSCIIWTLTIQTTIKYVIITLKADNHGEGGIFSLFALLRRKKPWLFIFAIVGGSTMLADGIITPSITVLSAVEGLVYINQDIPVLTVTLIIITVLFFIQQFGTEFIGKSFGPIMLTWFTVIGLLGFAYVSMNPIILKAFNPYFAYLLVTNHPEGFLLLGAVFLCTTGAEALYADLGHCGIKNIRISWIFVKLTLILNYLGQGAWILKQSTIDNNLGNPFYAIMPEWFIASGVLLATAAAIIASQALISGSYSLISEAISLNFWPRIRIKYPSHSKGQLYIPAVCWFLYFACSAVIISFKTSSALEAAYGLAITITMLMTTLLVIFYLKLQKIKMWKVLIFAVTYFIIEGIFLISNLSKFMEGGWLTVLIGLALALIMSTMYYGRKVRNRFISFYRINPYLPIINDLSNDYTVAKNANNLIYITHANHADEIEAKTIDSIIHRNPPKRSDYYWFLHIDITDDPYTLEYKLIELVPKKVYRIDFYIGFKVPTRINDYFKQVIKENTESGKLELLNSSPSLNKHRVNATFTIVQIDRSVIKQTSLPYFDGLALNLYYRFKKLGIEDIRYFGLESNQILVERIPLSIPGKEINFHIKEISRTH